MSSEMSPQTGQRPMMVAPLLRGVYSGNTGAVLERGFRVIAGQNWAILASGFFEPVFYLLAMGIGLGSLLDAVPGPGGVPMTYAAYLAPALLATSAMNGAIYDSTWNVFFKLRLSRLYEAMMQTSLGPMDIALGEIALALFRGFLYATGFLVVITGMGLVTSWWGVLMVPAAVLVAAGFASVGMAVTSFLKTFQHMDIITVALLPMFLFSATLYPIEIYPAALQAMIMALPLWHAVELMRQLSVGYFDASTPVHAVYFVVMTALGLCATTLRLRWLFLR
ncbi:MAG: ABC transporter permease [Ornithinimicrobium sp.]